MDHSDIAKKFEEMYRFLAVKTSELLAELHMRVVTSLTSYNSPSATNSYIKLQDTFINALKAGGLGLEQRVDAACTALSGGTTPLQSKVKSAATTTAVPPVIHATPEIAVTAPALEEKKYMTHGEAIAYWKAQDETVGKKIRVNDAYSCRFRHAVELGALEVVYEGNKIKKIETKSLQNLIATYTPWKHMKTGATALEFLTPEVLKGGTESASIPKGYIPIVEAHPLYKTLLEKQGADYDAVTSSAHRMRLKAIINQVEVLKAKKNGQIIGVARDPFMSAARKYIESLYREPSEKKNSPVSIRKSTAASSEDLTRAEREARFEKFRNMIEVQKMSKDAALDALGITKELSRRALKAMYTRWYGKGGKS